MPRDPSGNYTLPTNDSSPAAPRNVIRSSDFNELTSDYATALTDSLSRSGDGAMLADLDMDGFDLLNAPNLATAAQGALADSALQPLTRIQTRSDIIRGDYISDPLWASRIGDFDNGERGSLFIWNNPANADLIAGYNAGMQVWIGDNPVATPGAGHAAASTLAVVNGNGRNALYGQNILVGFSNSGAGFVDGFLCGMEINVYADFAATVTDAFAGGNRKNGLELTSQGTVGRVTAAAMIWSADNTGAAWWYEGLAVSRAVNNGIRFAKDPAGSVDSINAFQNAAILDESNSTSVLKVGGGHTSIFDLQLNPSFTNFVLGKNNAATSLLFNNGVNQTFDITINSGSSSAQNSQITLSDRTTAKWQVVKNTSNNFSIFNVATSLSSILINTSTDDVSTARNMFVGAGGNPLGISRVLSVNAASGTAGIDLQLAGGSKMFISTDGANYGQILTSGAYDLILGTNAAETTRLHHLGGIVVPRLSADPTAFGNGELYYNTSTNKFRGRAAAAWVDLH